MTALRIIFEPRPGHGDVQWLDWDPVDDKFVGGSFFEDGFDGEAPFYLMGFSDRIIHTEEDGQEADAFCGCQLAEGGHGRAVGNYMMLGVPSDDSIVMFSPCRVAFVQKVE